MYGFGLRLAQAEKKAIHDEFGIASFSCSSSSDSEDEDDSEEEEEEEDDDDELCFEKVSCHPLSKLSVMMNGAKMSDEFCGVVVNMG